MKIVNPLVLLEAVKDARPQVEVVIKDICSFEQYLEVAEEVLKEAPSHEKLLGRIVRLVDLPKGIELNFSFNYKQKQVVSKHNKDLLVLFPKVEHAAAVMTLGNVRFLDLNHDLLSWVSDSELKSLMQHELIHYRQMEDGRLLVKDNSMSWTVPGEEFIIDGYQDFLKKKDLSNIKDYYLYELKKPWEQEAYFSCDTRDIVANLTEEELVLVKSWVVPSLRHLVD